VGPVTPKFELGRDFCTVHLTTKFHHCLEVIMLTNKPRNKQSDAAENIHLTLLCYTNGYKPYILDEMVWVTVCGVGTYIDYSNDDNDDRTIVFCNVQYFAVRL